MDFNLVPEYRLSKFEDATVEFLLSIGIKGIILDIDNTLEPYEHANPGDNVFHWLELLSDAGIKTAIVSNNNRRRVTLFNKDIGMPAYANAAKPFKRNIVKAMRDMGTDTTNTIMMGDQIYTDVWGAHNAGIPAILVAPINDKNNLFTKIKRFLEKPVLERYERENDDVTRVK